MSTFFSLVTELETLLEKLNTILIGADDETVEVNGLTKDSISKAIKDNFSSLQAIMNGRKAYETKALLDADINIDEEQLAEVWNDTLITNNGLYGYKGGLWIKSPYDRYDNITDLQNEMEISISNLKGSDTSSTIKSSPSSTPSTIGDITYGITDDKNNLILSITSNGQINFYLPTSLADNLFLKSDVNNNSGLSNSNDDVVSVGFDINKNFFIKDLYVERKELLDYEYVIADENSNIAFSIDKKGEADLKPSALLKQRIQSFNTRNIPDYEYVLVDDNRNVAFSIDKKGEVDFKPSPELSEKIIDITGSRSKFSPVLTDITHIQAHGQSLQLGNGTSKISGVSTQGVLMPNNGLYDGQTGNADGLAGLPVISTGFDLMTSNFGSGSKEPPIIGACEQLQFLLDSHFGGKETTVFGSVSAHGGYPIRYLDKEGDPSVGTPSPNYELMAAQQAHYTEMQSVDGKSLLTQALLWIQGETDISQGTSKEEYKRRLTNLIYDYGNDVAQNYQPFMVTYQVASHTKRSPNHERDIALAQLELSQDEPLIFMACPTYVFPYISDGVHLQSHSSRWLGTYFGKALFHILTEGEFSPLQPSSIVRTGRVITIKFNVQHPPLVLDTTLVTDPGDYGFEVYSGDIKQSIESVGIINSNAVRIVLDTTPAESVTVKYGVGVTGSAAGPTTGARGNLRDSDPTNNYFDSEIGYDYSLYNWCVFFDIEE